MGSLKMSIKRALSPLSLSLLPHTTRALSEGDEKGISVSYVETAEAGGARSTRSPSLGGVASRCKCVADCDTLDRIFSNV